MQVKFVEKNTAEAAKEDSDNAAEAKVSEQIVS